MSQAKMGAVVQYCGHAGVFVADIFLIGNVNVIRASGPVSGDSINRDPKAYKRATHHLSDFPVGGFWQPQIGVFVVPSRQLKALNGGKAA